MIEARGLARTFRSRGRSVEAVRGVDLDVHAGELVGFLGPNGAGKTTTLRMLTTLLRPTAGRATVGGVDLLADPVGVRKKIGYVAQGGASLDAVRAFAGADVTAAKVEPEALAMLREPDATVVHRTVLVDALA